ncbi:hypothetical protein DL96DRAFT_1687530 [Flagelloscypha sp. PMI_526]|nr:hypothetical protein DL96DRAFT_1687530 [Flagelloscypha sp. PMI_526]
MVKFFALLAAGLPLALQVAAVPSLPRDITFPDGASKIAFDDDNKVFIAFNSADKELGTFPVTTRSLTRRAGTCVPMTNDDIGKMPGIDKLRAKADSNWGTGKRKEVVNDPGMPESPANICADDAGAVVVYDAKPDCKTRTNDAEGTLEGGKIILENSEGANLKTTTTVTKASTFGISNKIGVAFHFPGVADVSDDITTKSDFTNTQGDANEVGSDQRTVQRIEQTIDEGQNCKLQLSTNSCSVTGKGSLKMIASGMLWFEYGKRVDGHFKWGIPIEDVLTDINDRSSAIEFKTTGNLDASSHFSSEGCKNGTAVATPA